MRILLNRGLTMFVIKGACVSMLRAELVVVIYFGRVVLGVSCGWS